MAHTLRESTETAALPVAPSLDPSLAAAHVEHRRSWPGRRTLQIALLSIMLGVLAGFVAQALTRLIGLITNIFFYGTISSSFSSPAANRLGLFVIAIPVVGGLLVGLMARYGSQGIRGHGIPEAMEQVLENESRIPPRMTFLKPVSAAVAIGTGGPFGAEGPIIATGGALGSLLGQMLETTPAERKTLLAAGAAGGMAATFGSPISAVLLAVELLLFEFRPQSLLPVALGSASAASVRIFFAGTEPIFPMAGIAPPPWEALVGYLILGAIVGVASVYVTRAVYAVEDAFELLPVHWMWWPALGAVAVGVVGYFSPRTLGVGYENIGQILNGTIAGRALLLLFLLKFISWCISLGSGTSGGTLAPLFTIGGGLGATLGGLAAMAAPGIGMDVRIAALVGMAALFAGASRALLTSIVFAFETTLQPLGLLPLLAGCTTAYFVSSLLMENTIMTEKIARRGVRVPTEYSADFMEQIRVKECASSPVVFLRAEDTLGSILLWIATNAPGMTHQGFPVLDSREEVIGVVTRRDLLGTNHPPFTTLRELVRHPPIVTFEDATLRDASDTMAEHHVGRLPVVLRDQPQKVVGILSRSDILTARRKWLERTRRTEQRFRFFPDLPSRKKKTSRVPT